LCTDFLAFGKVGHRRFGKDITDSRLVVIGEGLEREAMQKVLL
jgi:hypothetical protein